MSSQNIAIHLPDGSVKEVPQGTTPLDIALSISPRLAAASVVARLTPLTSAAAMESTASDSADSEAAMYAAESAASPRLVDLSTPLTADTKLELLKENDPDALKVVRHSAAHVWRRPCSSCFQRPSWATAPPPIPASSTTSIAKSPSRPTTSPPSKKRWPKWSRATRNSSVSTSRANRPWRTFEKDGDFMKTHFVTKFTEPGSQVSFYRNGKFVDFCRGPHVPSTGRVKAVKVTNAGRRLLARRREESAAPAHLRHSLLLAKRDGRALRAS